MPTTCTVYACPGAVPETAKLVTPGVPVPITIVPVVSMMHRGDVLSPLGLEEMLQMPASNVEKPVTAVVMLTLTPATPSVGLTVRDPGAANPVKLVLAIVEVVGSVTVSERGPPVAPTEKLAVTVPSVFMVHCGVPTRPAAV